MRGTGKRDVLRLRDDNGNGRMDDGRLVATGQWIGLLLSLAGQMSLRTHGPHWVELVTEGTVGHTKQMDIWSCLQWSLMGSGG